MFGMNGCTWCKICIGVAIGALLVIFIKLGAAAAAASALMAVWGKIIAAAATAFGAELTPAMIASLSKIASWGTAIAAGGGLVYLRNLIDRMLCKICAALGAPCTC